MSLAIERVVVQITAEDKRQISAKAAKLDMPLSELMRRAAFAYSPKESDQALGELAQAAHQAASNAGAAIDDALAFMAKSNLRIAAMERKAAAARKPLSVAKPAKAAKTPVRLAA
jgi:hypothetical protein